MRTTIKHYISVLHRSECSPWHLSLLSTHPETSQYADSHLLHVLPWGNFTANYHPSPHSCTQHITGTMLFPTTSFFCSSLSRLFSVQFSSFQFSHSVMSDSLWPHESQHARPPCPSPTPRVYSNSCPSRWWCHPAISSSAIPFSCPQPLPASGSFQISQLFTWGGQSIGVSASASVLQKNTQDWSPLGWTGWISLQSKGLSRVFSNTTVQKHQIFGS